MQTTKIDQLEYLHVTAESIRAELVFDPRYGVDEHPVRGNCYEFALRTHAQIGQTAISNYVGYSFDHAFNIGQLPGGLFVASSDVIHLQAHEEADGGISEVVDVSTRTAIQMGSITTDLVTLFKPRKILEGLSNSQIAEMENTIYQKAWFTQHWLQAQMPAITIMEASFARDSLTNYNEFRRGLLYKDFEKTRHALELLRVRTPQHETRKKYNGELTEFEKAMRIFVRDSSLSTRDLCDLVEGYSTILPEPNTSANVVFGDCFRYIAKQKQSQRAVELALQQYTLAGDHSTKRRRSKDNPLVVAKLDKAAQLSVALASNS